MEVQNAFHQLKMIPFVEARRTSHEVETIGGYTHVSLEVFY